MQLECLEMKALQRKRKDIFLVVLKNTSTSVTEPGRSPITSGSPKSWVLTPVGIRASLHCITAASSPLRHPKHQEDFQSPGSLVLDQFFKPSSADIVLNRWCITKIEPFRSTVTFLLL